MPNKPAEMPVEGLVQALEIKNKISVEVPVSADKEILVEKPRAKIPVELPETPSVEVKNVFIPFDGAWMPDSDPIEIGAKNYKTLQNYRYNGDKIIHLESVLGYSKINTTSLSTYNYENIRNGHQLRTPYTKKTYMLVHTEHDTSGSNYSRVYQNQTTIPSQGNFESTALHTDSDYDLEGRFSDAPGSQLVYCNTEESCIWAGEEMPCAGFFTLLAPIYSAENDITFSKTASPDTIVTTAGNFNNSGFKAGHHIIVSESAGNDGEYVIVSISADGKTITLGEDVLHADESEAGGVTPIITVHENKDYAEISDYTEAINNEINSAAESATVIGAGTAAGFRWLVFSTRPLQGIKHNLRTINGTGSATTTCKYWNGSIFTAVTTPSDGTDSSGSMKQSGTFSFDSTVNVAKPLHFEGLYLYAYLFELSVGSAVIYNITLDAPFQTIVDVWDGVYRQPIQFQVRRGTTATGGVTITAAGTLGTAFFVGYPDFLGVRIACTEVEYNAIEIGTTIVANAITRTVTQKLGYGIINGDIIIDQGVYWAPSTSFTYTNPSALTSTADYKDFTLEVNEPSYADYPIGAEIDELTNEQHILIGFEERISAIWFEIIADRVNTNTAKIAIAYWNGTGYQSPASLFDTTDSNIGKCLNRSGLLSWQPPEEEDEFRQTLFGVNAYYYKITVDATLSGTADDDKHELIIDIVKGIAAQNVINPFKFSLQYKNRLMLCAFTKGQEGNRIDYSVKDAPDVFNGDESSMDGVQSLYIGGKEELTCAIEIFNRFGSNIISSLLLFKDNETYLLTGDGPDNYKIYCISKTIGCPAPLTLDAAETGYIYAEEINRNIAIWTSYAGPMIFDASAIIPLPGVNLYFDPAKSTRIQTSVIERCRGKVDNTYKEYNLVIPSATGATNCNLWLTYDLVRKRWIEKNPGASEIPQAIWPVYDTDGVQYLYAGIDDGNVMRLENGATWADDSATVMSPVIETGDFFSQGETWQETRLRRVKVAAKKISEASRNLTIYHYPDTTPHATITGSSDIDFKDTGPDTITDDGSGFVTAGFLAGMIIHVSGTSLNNRSFTIDTVAAGTLTLITSDEVTAEANQSAKIDSFTTLTALDLDSGHGDIVRATQGCNLLGWSHRLKFALNTGFSTEKQLHPIGWGMQFYVEREDDEN